MDQPGTTRYWYSEDKIYELEHLWCNFLARFDFVVCQSDVSWLDDDISRFGISNRSIGFNRIKILFAMINVAELFIQWKYLFMILESKNVCFVVNHVTFPSSWMESIVDFTRPNDLHLIVYICCLFSRRT